MNRIFALRSGNNVTVNINGEVRQLILDTEEEAVEVFKVALAAKNVPTDENVAALKDFVDPNHRLETCGILEKDRIGNFFLKGYNIPLPTRLVQRIMEYSREGYPLTALENFWKLCMLNPDPIARQDLFSFADQFAFPITDSGYFIAYKSVAGINMKHKSYATFVAQQYINLKAAMKKNPKDFTVVKAYGDFDLIETAKLDEVIAERAAEFDLTELAESWLHEKVWIVVAETILPEQIVPFAQQRGWIAPDLVEYWKTQAEFEVLGTLADLFSTISTLFDQEDRKFTDWHTRSMTIKLGDVVRMDREKCDSDPSRTCSSGLHVGAPEYVRKFGHGPDDFVIAVLVNPAHVVAVPVDYSFQKMRCCEYYPYALCEFDSETDVLKEIETPYFEADYCGYEKDQLEKELAEVRAKMLPRHDTDPVTEEEGKTQAELSEREALIADRLVLVGMAI